MKNKQLQKTQNAKYYSSGKKYHWVLVIPFESVPQDLVLHFKSLIQNVLTLQ